MVAETGDERCELTAERVAAAAEIPQEEEDQRLLDKYSKIFIGSFNHSLDSKGRMVVPLVFRESLGEKFCIAPSYDFKSICLYPTLMWARMRDRYARLGRVNRSLNRYLEQLDALSFRDQECDGQGRVLLPTKIRGCILGEEKDVEITGGEDCVRVVSRLNAEKKFQEFLNDLPDILDDMSTLEG